MVKDLLKKGSIFWGTHGSPGPLLFKKRKCGFYKKYKIIKGGVLGNLGSPDWFPSQKMT